MRGSSISRNRWRASTSTACIDATSSAVALRTTIGNSTWSVDPMRTDCPIDARYARPTNEAIGDMQFARIRLRLVVDVLAEALEAGGAREAEVVEGPHVLEAAQQRVVVVGSRVRGSGLGAAG